VELRFSKSGDVLRFHPTGRIAGPDARKLGHAIYRAVEVGAGSLSASIDLGGCIDIDDAAIAVLAEWHSRCRREGIALRLVRVPSQLRERFMLRGIYDFDDDEPIIV
jgi:ABC-type transporter Mla MlaB component